MYLARNNREEEEPGEGWDSYQGSQEIISFPSRLQPQHTAPTRGDTPFHDDQVKRTTNNTTSAAANGLRPSPSDPLLVQPPTPGPHQFPQTSQSEPRCPWPSDQEDIMAPLLTHAAGEQPTHRGATGTWPPWPTCCHHSWREPRPGSGSSRQRQLEMSWP